MTAILAQDHTTVAAAVYQATPLGYAQLSVTTVSTLDALLALASVPLVRPPQARWILVGVEGNGIRWTDDGQIPTTSYGLPIAVGAAANLSTDFANMRLVSQTGTAVVNVSFYR